jgi:hypothetical protein
MKIAALIQHRQVLDFLAENHLEAPSIPEGCNTFYRDLTLPDGRHAIILNQSGFTPTAEDNEEECNGLSLFIADEPPTPAIKAALWEWFEKQLDNPISFG